RAASPFACCRRAWPVECAARSAPTPRRSGQTDSAGGCGRSERGFPSSTSAAAPQKNQAASLESQMTQPIQYLLGQTLRLLYLLGTTVVASWPGAADDLAPVPSPPENSADIVKRTSIMMAKPPNAMRTRISRKPVAANGLSDERTSTALLFGNSATRLAALVLDGIALAGASGSASISSVKRTAAASLGIRARLVASFQGSTSSRASAERTLSPVPFRSSPIDAPRNWSNSGPMSGDNAAWVMSVPDPFHALPRLDRKRPSLRAPSESLAPGP